jgi:DNA-binding MarR family transcriptional regulator
MPALLALGYVERRPSRHRRGRLLWYVTPAGRALLVALVEDLKE